MLSQILNWNTLPDFSEIITKIWTFFVTETKYSLKIDYIVQILIYTLPNCLFHIVCPSTFLIFFDNKAFVHINFIWIILKLANSGLNMHIFDTSNLTWIVTEFPDFSTVIYCIGQKFACLFLKLFRIFRSSLEWNFSTTLILNKNTSGLIHGLH